MIDHGAKIKAVEVQGWYDAGKPETLLETNQHVLATWRGPPLHGTNVIAHEPVHVADGVTLEDAEIGPNVTVSPGAVRGSRLRDTIVGAGATVDGSDLHDSLIGAEARVRRRTGPGGRR